MKMSLKFIAGKSLKLLNYTAPIAPELILTILEYQNRLVLWVYSNAMAGHTTLYFKFKTHVQRHVRCCRCTLLVREGDK